MPYLRHSEQTLFIGSGSAFTRGAGPVGEGGGEAATVSVVREVRKRARKWWHARLGGGDSEAVEGPALDSVAGEVRELGGDVDDLRDAQRLVGARLRVLLQECIDVWRGGG
jgi:hypothetical protein